MNFAQRLATLLYWNKYTSCPASAMYLLELVKNVRDSKIDPGKKITELRKLRGEKRNKPLLDQGCDGYRPEHKPTNGDKLRAMSNEKLADFIAHHGSDCVGECANYPACRHCEKCWLEWLGQEVEREGDEKK